MSNFKKTTAAVISVVVVVVSGFFLKKQNDQEKEIETKNQKISQLKSEIEIQRKIFILKSEKRSEMQTQILSVAKILNTDLRKKITESNAIQFVEQNDFNMYEQKQNDIQNAVTKKLIEGLNSKDKKIAQYYQKNIKSLEILERDLNSVRMNYSNKVYELSKLENKKAVTFLSDTALIEFENNKN